MCIIKNRTLLFFILCAITISLLATVVIPHAALAYELNNFEHYYQYQYSKHYLDRLGIDFTDCPSLLIINLTEQNMLHIKRSCLIKAYKISSSKYGIGQASGSRKTPLGLHRISHKIGDNLPVNAIFKGARYTGRNWSPPSNQQRHKRDHIVTRIFRLTGLEPGYNSGTNAKGKSVDSYRRCIYIHGTTMEWKLGQTATIGCIHLSSADIIELFPQVNTETLVLIMP